MTPIQQQLSKILPSHYHKLCELPDEICQQLIPLAYYVKGDGLYAIQARVKSLALSVRRVKILLSMSESEIIKSFAKFKEKN